jgi:hypothetical protein
LNISETVWGKWLSDISKCSARCSASNDISHDLVGHSRRELARNGQVRVGGGQVIYQNAQLDELNPTMYNTWGWGVWNPFGPKFSLSPAPFILCSTRDYFSGFYKIKARNCSLKTLKWRLSHQCYPMGKILALFVFMFEAQLFCRFFTQLEIIFLTIMKYNKSMIE